MARYFMPCTTFGMDAECAVCCCLWTDPVELSGCQHIFCRGCVEGLETCPVCCGPVTSLQTPSKFILRLLQRTWGSCSACPWKGTYRDFKENHLRCPEADEVQSSDEEKVPTMMECVAMQEYYLEGSSAEHGGWEPSSAAMNPTLTHPGTVVNADSSPGQRIADITNNEASTADVRLTFEQRVQWQQSLASAGKDYGMPESEHRELMERFPDFGVLVSDKGIAPELRWRDACRLMRFLNYPNHPDDVKNLFEMAGRDAMTQSVPFHVLCLWLMLNRRNPAQWYNMTAEPYEQLLKVAQLLDVEATGLFQLDQCRILAEQYLERDVCDAEWSCIERLLRDKDTAIRQSFLWSVSRRRVDVNESFVPSSIKLALHDILCVLTRHVGKLRKEQQQSQGQRTREDYVRRIKRIVGLYDPAALRELDVTLQKFTGEEESLLMTLTAMYGPEPP
ncbi:hypothetical protein, conserved [Leishmania tarentolae]|uniref:RING-type domain-containing protein n=1 Tax=Leishmania tarentolae TaxID=5689 RepID=A0A640KM20_LEITA|nr:hypothetical protein, conserved [Leishmania tarentolae]